MELYILSKSAYECIMDNKRSFGSIFNEFDYYLIKLPNKTYSAEEKIFESIEEVYNFIIQNNYVCYPLSKNAKIFDSENYSKLGFNFCFLSVKDFRKLKEFLNS